MILREEFQVHEELNPKLFDTTSQTLLPEVRQKIIGIVTEFENYIEVPIEICDIQLVGSNCSYNYTENSDLDVHIIANFNMVDIDHEVMQSIYNVEKSSFNKNFDINIKGIEVELYVEDINSNTVSNGIYSVCDNVWIKEPKPIKSITKHNTEKEFEKWKNKITEVISQGTREDIANAINALYLMRKNSIAIDGEYGKGNQLFKDIRSAGLLDKLKSELNNAISKDLSLEGLSSGQIINRDID